jgi:uncharacterized protein (TIGR00288 family)
MPDESLIAVFVDFENLALGVKDRKANRFDIQLVLTRLLEKGRLVYKRAYCDWSRYRDSVREFHGQGIELIDIPQTRHSGKNSADIRMVVDALDLCYSKDHIDTFALLTGDSDFSPLASKLKENDKRVIGCGVRQSTSDLLIGGCDEFIYYDDLVEAAQERQEKKVRTRKKTRAKTKSKAKVKEEAPTKQEEAMDRIVQIVSSLESDYDPLWGSLVKQTLRRVDPGFNEKHYGYRTFADLMEDAAEAGLIHLEFDESRGNHKVRVVG